MTRASGLRVGYGAYLDEPFPFHVERSRVFVILSRPHARPRAHRILDRRTGRYGGALYVRFVLRKSAGTIFECEANPGDPHSSVENFDGFISK